jgi:hypothetical protein
MIHSIAGSCDANIRSFSSQFNFHHCSYRIAIDMKFSLATLVVLLASLSRESAEAFVSPQPRLGQQHAPPRQPFAPRSSSSVVSTTCSTTTSSPTQLNVAASNLVDTQQLTTFFLETVISNGVPAFFTILVIAFAANAFRPKKNDMEFQQQNNNPVADLYNDLYGDSLSNKPSSPFRFLGAGRQQQLQAQQNTGVPAQQYIKIQNRNARLDSYQYSMNAATTSKALAAAQARSRNFDKALQLGMSSSMSNLTASQKSDLLQAEQDFLKRGSQLQGEIASLQMQLTKSAINDEMEAIGMDSKGGRHGSRGWYQRDQYCGE